MPHVYSTALTEPVFIFLILCHFAAVLRYFESGRVGALLTSAFSLGGACILRYSGVFLAFPAFLLLLAVPSSDRKTRIASALCWSLAVFLPLTLWLLRNMTVSETSSVGNRGMSVHLIRMEQVRELMETVASFILPGAKAEGLPGAYMFLRIGAAACALLGIGYCLLRAGEARGIRNVRDWFTSRVPAVSLASVVSYLAFLPERPHQTCQGTPTGHGGLRYRSG